MMLTLRTSPSVCCSCDFDHIEYFANSSSLSFKHQEKTKTNYPNCHTQTIRLIHCTCPINYTGFVVISSKFVYNHSLYTIFSLFFCGFVNTAEGIPWAAYEKLDNKRNFPQRRIFSVWTYCNTVRVGYERQTDSWARSVLAKIQATITTTTTTRDQRNKSNKRTPTIGIECRQEQQALAVASPLTATGSIFNKTKKKNRIKGKLWKVS